MTLAAVSFDAGLALDGVCCDTGLALVGAAAVRCEAALGLPPRFAFGLVLDAGAPPSRWEAICSARASRPLARASACASLIGRLLSLCAVVSDLGAKLGLVLGGATGARWEGLTFAASRLSPT